MWCSVAGLAPLSQVSYHAPSMLYVSCAIPTASALLALQGVCPFPANRRLRRGTYEELAAAGVPEVIATHGEVAPMLDSQVGAPEGCRCWTLLLGRAWPTVLVCLSHACRDVAG